jgi:hypothetical protein
MTFAVAAKLGLTITKGNETMFYYSSLPARISDLYVTQHQAVLTIKWCLIVNLGVGGRSLETHIITKTVVGLLESGILPDNKIIMGTSYATQPLMVALDDLQALSARMATETRIHWTRLEEILKDEMPMQQQGQGKDSDGPSSCSFGDKSWSNDISLSQVKWWCAMEEDVLRLLLAAKQPWKDIRKVSESTDAGQVNVY